MKKTQFEEIYASAFDDSPRWRRWFFDEVVPAKADGDIFLADDSAGRAAASALLREYAFAYSGGVVPSGYISCVATRPEARTRGLASRAVGEALVEARRRGYAFCELIPANRSLMRSIAVLDSLTVFMPTRSAIPRSMILPVARVWR